MSGLQLNLKKSEILLINNWSQNDLRIIGSLGVQILKKIKITGTWFTEDFEKFERINTADIIEKIIQKTADLKSRGLSLEGRLTTAKSILQGILQYRISTLKLNSKTVKAMDKIIFRYVWKGAEGAPRARLRQEREKGGLNLRSMGEKMQMQYYYGQ